MTDVYVYITRAVHYTYRCSTLMFFVDKDKSLKIHNWINVDHVVHVSRFRNPTWKVSSDRFILPEDDRRKNAGK